MSRVFGHPAWSWTQTKRVGHPVGHQHKILYNQGLLWITIRNHSKCNKPRSGKPCILIYCHIFSCIPIYYHIYIYICIFPSILIYIYIYIYSHIFSRIPKHSSYIYIRILKYIYICSYIIIYAHVFSYTPHIFSHISYIPTISYILK